MANRSKCECAEGYTDRDTERGKAVRFKVPTNFYVHNCEYILLRNSCIKEAESEAGPYEKGGTVPEQFVRATAWNKMFTEAMERLVKEARYGT